MKLESYWIFKEILLMFNYILVVSRGYILLISICSMLKIGKLLLLAIYLQFYLKIISRGQKYGGFLLNCTKLPLIVSCWKSWQSTLWVDFKMESALLKTRRKKRKLYNSLRNVGNYRRLSITQNPNRGEAIIWITHKLVQDNESSSFWI